MHDATYSGPDIAPPDPQGGRKTWVIVIIVLLVLCCLCLIAAGLAWQFGDLVLEMLGFTF